MPKEHTNANDWVYCTIRDSWFVLEPDECIGYDRVIIRWIDDAPKQIVSYNWLRHGANSGTHIWAGGL